MMLNKFYLLDQSNDVQPTAERRKSTTTGRRKKKQVPHRICIIKKPNLKDMRLKSSFLIDPARSGISTV